MSDARIQQRNPVNETMNIQASPEAKLLSPSQKGLCSMESGTEQINMLQPKTIPNIKMNYNLG